MANQRIIDLPNGSALTGTEPLETVQGGISVQVPVSATATFLSGTFVPYSGATGNVGLGIYTLTAAQVNINNTSGNGYLQVSPLLSGSIPTQTGGAVQIYSGPTSDLSWKRGNVSDTFTRTFASVNTANRTYTLPDASGNVVIGSGAISQYIKGDGSFGTFPTDLGSFTNGPGYLTSSSLTGYAQTASALTTGSVLFANSAGKITQDNAKFFWDDTNFLLYIGSNSGAFSNTKLQISDSSSTFSQFNYTNTSAGITASGDYVITSDTGTNTTNYVNLGINSSTNSDPTFTIATALDSYLYSNGGNMVIGTQSAKDLVFFTGGTGSSNEVGRFNSSGNFSIKGIFSATGSNATNINHNVRNTNANGYCELTVYNDLGTSYGSIFTLNSTSTVGSLYDPNTSWLSANAVATGIINENTSGKIKFATGGFGSVNEFCEISPTGVAWQFWARNQTNLTASTAVTTWNVTGSNKTWNDGGSATTITSQIGYNWGADTYNTTGGGSTTFTSAYGHVFNAPTLGTNVSATNLWAARFIGNVQVTGGINVSAASTFGASATVSYSAAITTTSTINKVTITQPTTSATLTLVTGSSLITAGAFALTLTSSATTNATFPSGTGTLAYLAGTNSWTGVTTFSPTARSSGATAAFTITGPADTNQTLSIAVPKILLTLGSTQWATGALAATQPFLSITQPTISFVGLSTATKVASVYIAGAPIQGTNATNTTSIALLIDNLATITGAGTSYGLFANAQTGGTVNYAAGFSGNSAYTLGSGLIFKAGTNAKAGQATLASGTVTVSTTAVASTSIVIVTGIGTTASGWLTVSITAGTSFTITSSNGTDARIVNWLILDQN